MVTTDRARQSRVRQQLLREAQAHLSRAALALSFAEDADRAAHALALAKDVQQARRSVVIPIVVPAEVP